MHTGRRRQFEFIPAQDRGRHGHWTRSLVFALALAAVGSPTTASQDPIADDNDPRVKAAVARAANFLRGRGTPPQVGELSLAIHALAKTRAKFPDVVPADDPVLNGMVEALRARCLPNFQPTRQGGPDNYEAGCAAMALAAVSRTAYSDELRSIAEYLLKKQLPNGAWSYEAAAPGGDTSMTQYALLGLWEANNGGGGPIPKEAWDRAASWLVTRQSSTGGFAYHPRDPGPGVVQPEPTHTMTVASLGSLYLCRDHLPGGKRRDNRGVLQPVEAEGPADEFKPQAKPEALRNAIDAATKWVVQNFTLDQARGEGDATGKRWFYYYLYAFERFATLANLKVIAGVDWYSKTADLILTRQQANGSWTASNGEIVETSFAVLCLVRSTRTSIEDVRKRLLSKGTLYYPGDLDELIRGASKLRYKPVRGPGGRIIDIVVSLDPDLGDEWIGLDKVLEPGRPATSADGPPSPPEERRDVLRRVLEKGYLANDSLIIKTALRGLAITGDYRVVPLLVDAMYYESESGDVQLAARRALCMISRKPNGFGYSKKPSREEWAEEIDKWKAWYRTVRPQGDVEDDVVLK